MTTDNNAGMTQLWAVLTYLAQQLQNIKYSASFPPNPDRDLYDRQLFLSLHDAYYQVLAVYSNFNTVEAHGA